MFLKKYRKACEECLETISRIDRVIGYVLFLADAPEKWRRAQIHGELKRREERNRLRNRWLLNPFTLLRVWISSLNAQVGFFQHYLLNTHLKKEGVKELYREEEEFRSQIARESARPANGQHR